MSRAWAVAWCGVLSLLTGCGADPTEIMLVVRTDLRVPPSAAAELDELVIEVSRTPDRDAVETVAEALDEVTPWPARLLLVAPEGRRTAFVRVSGRLEGAAVVTQDAYVTFVPEQTKMLVMDLLAACEGVVCEEGATCRDGACEAVDRREEDLRAWTGTPPEALVAPRFCTGEWEDIVELSVTENTDYDDDPSITEDLLELYFSSNRGGTPDTWFVRRDSADDPWGAPSLVEGLSGTATEEVPAIAPDGLRLWFASDVGLDDKDVFVMSRPSRDAPWGSPVQVELWGDSSESWTDRELREFDGGRRMIVSSTRRDAGESQFDLFIAERTGDFTEWSEPVRLSQVSDPVKNDMGPFPSPRGDRLYFHRQENAGSANLYVADRVARTGEYGAPRPLEALNAFEVESYTQDMNISRDECFAVFARQFYDDALGKDVSNIYVATRSE